MRIKGAASYDLNHLRQHLLIVFGGYYWRRGFGITGKTISNDLRIPGK